MLCVDTTKRVVALSNDLQEISDPYLFKVEALSRLENIFGAMDSVFLDWTHFASGDRPLSGEDMFFHKFDDQVGGEYYLQTFQEDPIYEWIDSGRCKKDLNVTRFSHLTNYSDIKKTRFYSKLLNPLNCRYIMSIALHEGSEVTGSISLIRPAGTRDFTPSDVQLGQIMTPMLAGAYRSLLLRQKSDLREDIFHIVSSKCQHQSFLLLSDSLETVYRSDKAKNTLSSLGALSLTVKELLSQSDTLAKYTETFLSPSHAVQKRLPKKVSDIVYTDQGRNFHVELESHVLNAGNRYLSVGFQLSEEAHEESLQSQYGLTMRELQVAEMATMGLNSEKVGQQLCISQWSVKNHLSNIYRKTGINNRASLAVLLFNSQKVGH